MLLSMKCVCAVKPRILAADTRAGRGAVPATVRTGLHTLSKGTELPQPLLSVRGDGRLSRAPRSRQGRLVVAVDIDEVRTVLGRFVHSLNAFCADELGLQFSESQYDVYNFAQVWRCSPEVANERVHAFFQSEHFAAGIEPLPGARSSLTRLKSVCDLVVVTSRQTVIREATEAWLDKHFTGIFDQVLLGNHFAQSGSSRSKADMCRDVGASILVDDNPTYALECADAGIDVLHMDHLGAYPWAKGTPAHVGITPVQSWLEIEVAINVKCASSDR